MTPAIFYARCSKCQHVESFAHRPDQCSRCHSPLLIILPICQRSQRRLGRKEKGIINGWSRRVSAGAR